MSRQKAIRDGKRHLLDASNRDEYVPSLTNVLGRTYDAGFIEGSGQSSITALEREVIVAALEWFRDYDHGHSDSIDPPLLRAMGLLTAALEREATE